MPLDAGRKATGRLDQACRVGQGPAAASHLRAVEPIPFRAREIALCSPLPSPGLNSVTAQVNADGSGTLSALLLNSGGNGETETGTESWICVTEPGV